MPDSESPNTTEKPALPESPPPEQAVPTLGKTSLLDKVIRFSLENKLVVALAMIAIVGWGVLVAPFDWELGGLRSDPTALPKLFRPVPTDAIPDI
ncbi:MAG: hypothetical protein IID45_07665, partial [Planctomycetes bacterium]|nr:hypothetical protein [Planctomycetota bacterium]